MQTASFPLIMRLLITILLVLPVKFSFAQGWSANVADIDWNASSVATISPDSLALTLTAPCTTDLQKVRAIFGWITDNIAYRVKNNYKPDSDLDDPIILDTSSSLQLFNEKEARRVLKRKVAVCEGYARLFKTLCDYAGIRSEIIFGFARGGIGRISKTFKTNHSWNAVFLDSSWHLLDATWASGYTDYSGYEFIKHYNDFYFLTPPRQFAQDHFPENLQWTLLEKPPVLREFYNTPFKTGSFIRHRIQSFSPSKGIIEASVGDSIMVELEADDVVKEMHLSPTPLPDSILFIQANALDTMSSNFKVMGKKVQSIYVVKSDTVEWLDVICNGETVMRYKVQIKKEKEPKPEQFFIQHLFPLNFSSKNR